MAKTDINLWLYIVVGSETDSMVQMILCMYVQMRKLWLCGHGLIVSLCSWWLTTALDHLAVVNFALYCGSRATSETNRCLLLHLYRRWSLGYHWDSCLLFLLDRRFIWDNILHLSFSCIIGSSFIIGSCGYCCSDWLHWWSLQSLSDTTSKSSLPGGLNNLVRTQVQTLQLVVNLLCFFDHFLTGTVVLQLMGKDQGVVLGPRSGYADFMQRHDGVCCHFMYLKDTIVCGYLI